MQIQLSLLQIIENTGKPLGEVQISEIATGVGLKGISPASVYTYYGTKEEVLREAAEARLLELIGQVDLRFHRTETFGEYVTRFIGAMISLWEENAAVLRAAAGLAACGPEYQRWWQGLFVPWAKPFRSAVEEARATGELPEVPGELDMLINIASWAVASSCQQMMAVPETEWDRHLLHRTLTLAVRRILGDPC